MKSRINTKYFPFSPGIPWQIENGKYILPTINMEVWQNVMAGKSGTIVCFGGLLEAYYSLFILEALRAENPQRQLFWASQSAYKRIFEAQGISLEDSSINSRNLRNYPVPLFFNSAGTKAYFNVLNNYLEIRGFRGLSAKPNKKPIGQQIFSNSLIDYSIDYLPKLRAITKVEGEEYQKWLKKTVLYPHSQFVLIFPHKTGCGIHDINCLGWSVQHVKEFAAMLRGIGIPLVVCTAEENKRFYYNSPIIFADLSISFTLISKAWAVLAHEIDYLSIAAGIGNAAIISKTIDGAFNLYKNIDFIQAENVIFTSNELLTLDVFMFLKGVHGS